MGPQTILKKCKTVGPKTQKDKASQTLKHNETDKNIFIIQKYI